MVYTPKEEIERRIKTIQESSDFNEAATRLGVPITTLKAWARRNPKWVPHSLYEARLLLTPGEREQRRHSLEKATSAASQARRGGPQPPRNGRVHRMKVSEKQPEISDSETEDRAITPILTPDDLLKQLSFRDLMAVIPQVMELVAAEVDQVMIYRDQVDQLQLRIADLEADLAEERKRRMECERQIRKGGEPSEVLRTEGKGLDRSLAELLRGRK